MDTSHIRPFAAQDGDDSSEFLAPARLSMSRTSSILHLPSPMHETRRDRERLSRRLHTQSLTPSWPSIGN